MLLFYPGADKGRSEVIATGYYLPINGAWRKHSWVVTPSGIILDPHSAGRQYFGIRLDGIGALLFAERECDFTTVLRWVKKNSKLFTLITEEALLEMREASSP